MLLRTKSHHRFNQSAIVPAPVKQNNLSGIREMFDIAFDMQFCFLVFIGFAQGHHVISFFIHIAGYPADGPAFARGIPAIEKDHHFFPGSFKMALHFDKLRLVRFQLLCIVKLLQYRLNNFFFIFLFKNLQDLSQTFVRSDACDLRFDFLQRISDLRRRTRHPVIRMCLPIFNCICGFHNNTESFLFIIFS